MNQIFLFFMLSGSGSPDGANPLALWMPFILIFAIMYFLIFRPQAKKQKQQQAMIQSLKKGDKVITAGGIFGTIAGIKEKDNTLIIKIADNVKIEIVRTSITKKLE
ncbi:MAG: preprotein translocase subunit YajC [bacterium]